jgi:hypothetical protein
MAGIRKARFKIRTLDGTKFDNVADEATVTITIDEQGGNAVMSVRPKHARHEHSLTLQQVANFVIQKASLS